MASGTGIGIRPGTISQGIGPLQISALMQPAIPVVAGQPLLAFRLRHPPSCAEQQRKNQTKTEDKPLPACPFLSFHTHIHSLRISTKLLSSSRDLFLLPALTISNSQGTRQIPPRIPSCYNKPMNSALSVFLFSRTLIFITEQEAGCFRAGKDLYYKHG